LIPKYRQSTPPQRKLPGRGGPQTIRLASTEKKARNQSTGWLLLYVLINGLVLSPMLFLFNFTVIDHHEFPSVSSVRQVIASKLPDVSPLTLLGDFDDDSLGAMLPALKSFAADSQISPYDSLFFRGNVKFQYPLTSLLPLYLLQRAGVGDDDLSLVFNGACCIALLGVIVFSIWIALRLIHGGRPTMGGWGTRAIVSVIVTAACLLFYPITHGLYLGQIQTILTCGFTAAFFCWISGREKTSGAILGVMALVKPQ
jgi:Glycosyltransferase family 87